MSFVTLFIGMGLWPDGAEEEKALPFRTGFGSKRLMDCEERGHGPALAPGPNEEGPMLKLLDRNLQKALDSKT